MNISDATIDVAELNLGDLLSDWGWLVKGTFTPSLMTAFGDLFLENEKGEIWFLDLVGGEFSKVAETRDAWAAMFNDPEVVENWLMPGLVSLLIENCQRLGKNECYGYKIAPVLGGPLSAENIEVTDLSVHFCVLGQIHEQTKDLPPGTPISKIQIGGEDQ